MRTLVIWVLINATMAFAKPPGSASLSLGLYWVPRIDNNTWKSVHTTNLVCPSFVGSVLPEMEESFEVDIQVPKHSQTTSHQGGYLCYGFSFSVVCEEGFWGGQKVTEHTFTHLVSSEECLKAIEDKKSGEYRPPHTPVSECGWMQTNTKTLRFVALEEHPVLFDPYTVNFVDGLFEKTLCNQRICPTVHANTIWIGDNEPKKDCPSTENEKAVLYVEKQNVVPVVWVKLTGGTVYKLDRACTMTYCDIDGVRMEDGHWFAGVNLTQYVRRNCDKGMDITFDTLASLSLLTKIELEHVQDRMECLDAVQDLRAGGKVTYAKLSKLQPRRGGLFHVYRINKGTLEYTMGRYEGLTSLITNIPFVIGKNQKDEKVRLPHIPSGDNSTLSSYNGVHMFLNGTVIIPEMELYKLRYSETLLYEHLLGEMKHPSAKQRERMGLTPDDDKRTTNKSLNIGEWFTSFWSHLVGKIVSILGTALAIFLILYICWICLKIQIKRVSDKNRVDQMEMQILSKARAPEVRPTLSGPIW
uniref:Glycoprotein n=1 Tax=Moussa virus TaxID=698672 RepID=D2E9Y1_9RHAB|nr:glycoprotein [Moussa virus]